MTLLYINVCVRKNSRTNFLAQYLLENTNTSIDEIVLNAENIYALNADGLEKRDNLIQNKEFDNPIFAQARQFANADVIIIAAPFWDLSFPALLKIYFENINVSGITFKYSEKGIPESLCKAQKLIYITTSGGYIANDDYGFGYVKALANIFYGINDITYFKAQGLDIIGNNTEKILDDVKLQIKNELNNIKYFKF